MPSGSQASRDTEAGDEVQAKRDTEPGEVAAPVGPGQRVGRYRLAHRVGTGSMGVVWLGYDPRLARPVAIKRIRPRGDGVEQREIHERMTVEARALGRLSHPNVVSIHDAGLDKDGASYLVMEYVPSSPLHKWLADADPTAEQVIEVFREAGRALAAAHDVGIVHRDFKPANLLVAKDRSVKVVDFGLALDQGRSSERRITQTGASVGTPNYMAPEVMLGDEADARTDQYSFCVAFFEALYGFRPFKASSLEKLRAAVVKGRRQPSPERPDVSDPVREAIERGLGRDPRDRYASMDELLEQLHPDPPVGPNRRVLTMYALLLAAATFVLAIAIAFAFVALM